MFKNRISKYFEQSPESVDEVMSDMAAEHCIELLEDIGCGSLDSKKDKITLNLPDFFGQSVYQVIRATWDEMESAMLVIMDAIDFLTEDEDD